NTTTQTVVQVVLASGAMIRAPMPRIEPEIWAHVAFVVNRDMKSLRLYRDGKVVNVEALPADPIAAQGEPLRLSIPATAAVNVIGLMDVFMIWKRALSDGEIAGVYEAGRNGDSLKDECGGGGGGSGTLYTPLIATDVTGDMRGVNPSIYIRIPFEISDPALVGKLDLAMNYDDGFVCYLNGVEVARRNAGSQAFLPFNATAVTDRPDPAALTPEVIPLSGRIPLLVPGTNVLAIQGLNVTADAARFVIRPALCVEQVVAEDCIKTTEGRDFWLTFPGNAPADTNNPLHLTVCITGPAGT